MTRRAKTSFVAIFISFFCSCHEPIEQAAISDESPATETRFDLNSVTSEELQSIKGIGPKTAAKIIAFRDEFTFKRVEDLLAVEGIGEATFLKLRNHFYVSEEATQTNR